MRDVPAEEPYLLLRAGSRICALPVGHVVECFRPRPIERLAKMPPHVLGVAIIRGVPVPVVDLSNLLGAATVSPGRFVTVRTGHRHVALAAESVIGVQRLQSHAGSGLPPLLREASAQAVTMLGSLDAELLVVLDSSLLVPVSLWSSLEMGGGQA